MRRILRSLILVAVVVACALPVAAGQAPPAGDVQTFGAPVTVKKAVKLDNLQKNPAKFAGQTLRLEGVVAEVCQGRGCWIEIASPKGVSFIARSLDETILVPKDCKGQKVVIQGVVTAMPAKTHDHAEEGHSCPAPTFVLSTQGVELIAKK